MVPIYETKVANYLPLHSNECIDIANIVILSVYVIWTWCDTKEEFFLFSVWLLTNITSSKLYKNAKYYIVKKCDLELKCCVGLCSDSRAAMTRKQSKVVTQIKEFLPKSK